MECKNLRVRERRAGAPLLIRREGCKCNVPGARHARGLCDRCYREAHRRGTLEQFPAKKRRWADTLYEYRFYRETTNYSIGEIASALGITEKHLKQLFKRKGVTM